MQVNILCIGDVVGRPGRYMVAEYLPKLVKEHDIHCVIANVENAAAGSGLTNQLYEKFKRYGVHLLTLGDHLYRKADIIPILEKSNDIVRPANFPPQSVGKTFAIYQTAVGPKVAVISLLGRLYMRPPTDCPFRAVDQAIRALPPDVNIVVVDMHAEATSEKVAMGWHLDGRASLVFGTHTHIQTADECILPGGTAYITDVGMTGPYDSVLGRRKDRVLRNMLTNLPAPFDVATDDPRLCGVLVSVETNAGVATRVQRIRVDADKSKMPEMMNEPE
jgi:metallophosphoesterase (TIGR00282 family)